MRELGRERRTLLASALDAACSVAEQHGRRISGAVATAVEQTLRAATADEGAAAAVQSGRLLQVLSADGVDTVDLDGAVAVPGAVAAARKAAPAPADGRKPDTTADVPAAGRSDKPRLQAVRQAPRPASPSALEKAQAAERAASEAADEAVRQAQERLEQQEAAKADFERLSNEAKELRAQLKAIEEKLESTRKLKETLGAEAKQSARAADKAQRTAMLARERALRLGNTRG
jgi:chromosome segregation ATPase